MALGNSRIIGKDECCKYLFQRDIYLLPSHKLQIETIVWSFLSSFLKLCFRGGGGGGGGLCVLVPILQYSSNNEKKVSIFKDQFTELNLFVL